MAQSLTSEEFWGVHNLVFEKAILPSEGAEMLSEMILAHLQEDITKEIIDKITEGIE